VYACGAPIVVELRQQARLRGASAACRPTSSLPTRSPSERRRPGTNCNGVFDFSAKVGDKRLVFGKFRDDGSFWPDHFVYVRKEDKDKIPAWLYRAVFPTNG
jgi:hypothetical protein